MGNEKDNKMQNDETLAINSLNGFKLGHLNITSLPKHVDELRLQLIIVSLRDCGRSVIEGAHIHIFGFCLISFF